MLSYMLFRKVWGLCSKETMKAVIYTIALSQHVLKSERKM